MKNFEYRITQYPADDFRELVFVCSNSGECERQKIPTDQMDVLARLLNDMGQAGWELVQLAFAEVGVVAFWKRDLQAQGPN
jgi:hypothetical protein